MTRVTTGSRLHFGLMNAGDLPGVARFGGLGLMVNEPAVVVRTERAAKWSATGPSAERALAAARAVVEDGGCLRMVVEACPPEHVGLGVGTQLGLAAASAALREVGKDVPPGALADAVGRGGRSGIGIEGFQHGGFFFDEGKGEDGCHTTRRCGWRVPWAFVLARPKVHDRWHGSKERAAFARPRDAERSRVTAARLRSVAETEILPALAVADFNTFGNALYEYNRLAGEAFAEDQGGVYASPDVARLIEDIRARGVPGVGQSSWGPTVYALCRDRQRADELAAELRSSLIDLDDVTATAVRTAGLRYDDAS